MIFEIRTTSSVRRSWVFLEAQSKRAGHHDIVPSRLFCVNCLGQVWNNQNHTKPYITQPMLRQGHQMIFTSPTPPLQPIQRKKLQVLKDDFLGTVEKQLGGLAVCHPLTWMGNRPKGGGCWGNSLILSGGFWRVFVRFRKKDPCKPWIYLSWICFCWCFFTDSTMGFITIEKPRHLRGFCLVVILSEHRRSKSQEFFWRSRWVIHWAILWIGLDLMTFEPVSFIVYAEP